MYRISTPEALALKHALEYRGVIVEAEKWDGHKHLDLAIHRARMNIEVDGRQHYMDPFQILSDLARNHHSTQKGYDTVHIPNEFVRSDLDKIADALTIAAHIRSNRLGHRFHYKHKTVSNS
jgi:very-short-patch-repair endonuclease